MDPQGTLVEPVPLLQLSLPSCQLALVLDQGIACSYPVLE